MADGTCSVEGCPNGIHCRELCQPHYMRLWHYGDPLRGGPLKTRVRATEENFWIRVNKNGPLIADRPDLGPCWLWLGRLNAGGYGIFGSRNRVSQLVHRLSWERANGREIDDGQQMDHLCHTYDLSCRGGRCEHRSCLSPLHLEPVTHRENSLRSVRARTGRCSEGHELVMTGTRNGNPKRGCATCRAARRHEQRDEFAETPTTRHPSRVMTPELLQEVATVYAAALLAGESPRLTVAAHFRRSPATISPWIARSREAGLLSPYKDVTATT